MRSFVGWAFLLLTNGDPQADVCALRELNSTFPCRPARFGAANADKELFLRLANPIDACDTLQPHSSGDLVLAYRGRCSFYTKAINAIKSGAGGLIIADNQEGDLISLIRSEVADPAENERPIPIVSVLKQLGDQLAALLEGQQQGPKLSLQFPPSWEHVEAENRLKGLLRHRQQNDDTQPSDEYVGLLLGIGQAIQMQGQAERTKEVVQLFAAAATAADACKSSITADAHEQLAYALLELNRQRGCGGDAKATLAEHVQTKFDYNHAAVVPRTCFRRKAVDRLDQAIDGLEKVLSIRTGGLSSVTSVHRPLLLCLASAKVLCSHCAPTVLTLCSHCTRAVLPLHSHCTHTVLSLSSHCPLQGEEGESSSGSTFSTSYRPTLSDTLRGGGGSKGERSDRHARVTAAAGAAECC
jgi:hypothetical protein